MSPKVFAAALAVLAMQALCSQSSSIRPAADGDVNIRTRDIVEILKNLNVGGGNKIDTSEITTDVQGILNSLELAGNEKTSQSLGTGADPLQMLQNILNSVKAEIQKGLSTLVSAVTEAQEEARKTAEDTVKLWIQQLRDVLDQATGLADNECQDAEEPYLQNVADFLRDGVENCRQIALTDAQEPLSQLEEIRLDVATVIENATQVISDCQTAGTSSILCVAARLPGAIKQITGLPVKAAQFAVLSSQLTDTVLRQSAVCVSTAAIAGGREASEVIEATIQCVAGTLNASTTAA